MGKFVMKDTRPWRRASAVVVMPQHKADVVKTVAGKVGRSLRFLRRDMVALKLGSDADLVQLGALLAQVLPSAGKLLLPAAPFDLQGASSDVIALIDLLGSIALPGGAGCFDGVQMQEPVEATVSCGKGMGKGSFEAWKLRQARLDSKPLVASSFRAQGCLAQDDETVSQ